MNVYDEAHNLEKAIRESEEFKQMAAAKEKVDADPDLKRVIDDFHQKQLALQTKQMMGEEVGQDAMQSVQDLYAVVAKDPAAADFLQCEMRFGMMMQDVYKILGDVLGIGK
ncbi:MAG: YlbF family regulator [Eubacteriaceae bacterium]|nr:YlbF family regulator [Eubacteriaceae bacterium]